MSNDFGPFPCRLALGLAVLLVVGCDSGSQVKSGCLINGDCARGEQCISGKCVTPPAACTTDEDCAAGKACLQGLCQDAPPPTGCHYDDDCNATPETPLCLSNNVCGECRSTADCGDSKMQCSDQHVCVYSLGNCGREEDCSAPSLATTPHCDILSNRCVGCVDSGQCSTGYFCSMGTQTCQVDVRHCASDGDCSSPKPHCETSFGVCQECTSASQCGTGKTCQNGTCVTGGSSGCAQDSECPGALPVCDTSTGNCVECVINGQCSAGRVCTAGTCQVPVSTGCAMTCSGSQPVCDEEAGLCVVCGSDADCPGSEYCVYGACFPAPVCETSLDCPNFDDTCDSVGQCIECTWDLDCPSFRDICINGECRRTVPNLGCRDLVHCENNCFGSSCSYCSQAATSEAVSLYDAALNCISAECSSVCDTGTSAECSNCQDSAQLPGGVCYPKLVACIQDG